MELINFKKEKKLKKLFLTMFFVLLATPAFAKMEIITSYQYIQSITENIGKDKVNVSSFSKGSWDPHFVIPKPSLIARARKADLLIINGAQLEIGWLPPIIRQANNPEIQPGVKGFLDLSQFIKLIQVPTNVSRGQGDVHPFGNPHFHLDPNNIPLISDTITEKLCQLDNGNCKYYETNNQTFKKKWSEKLTGWNKKLKMLNGTKIIEYHRVFDYLINRYDMSLFATLEPLPGIPPTPKHISETIAKINKDTVKYNFRAIYNISAPSEYVSSKTSAKLITLPHDVDSVKEATDIFSLFDEIVKRLSL